MKTSLKAGFAQIFSCCPKNLSCPKFGGAAAPLAPPARTPMLRDERFLPFAFIFYFAFKVAITRGRVSKLLHEKSVLKNSDFRAPKD